MPIIHTLSADIPLTKSYGTDREGGVTKSPYPNCARFTSESHNVKNIAQLYEVVTAAASKNHCLIKGALNRPLDDESRAGSTDSYGDTQWVCFDIDKSNYLKTPDQFLTMIGAEGVSHIVQYSSSYGISHNSKPLDERLSCHIFMLLDKPVNAQLLKQWLLGLNFQYLSEETTLTASANSLSYTLDITTCQNDKLLYVAPPVFMDNRFTDTIKDKRIVLVKGAKPVLKLDVTKIPAKASNYAKIAARVDDLRAVAGLPKRSKTSTIKHHDKLDVTYLSKPDQATITGVKVERGFVYLNLNGGDSWGYYFPEDDCEVVKNFKGEPNYLLKELAPDFYGKYKRQLKEKQSNEANEATLGAEKQSRAEGRYYLAFRDFKTGDYFNGWYDYDSDKLELHKAKNAAQLDSFMKQYGLEIGDFVPDWNVVYDPQSDITLDVDNRVINLYKPSAFDYKELREPGEWPTILRVIDNALGTNQEDHPADIRQQIRDHFLNWLAFIIQTKKPAGTSWVLHGTTGTGKGTLFHKILRPLLGASNCNIKHVDDFQSQFNGWMATNVLVLVDEVQMSKLTNSRIIEGKLRTWMTEPYIDIREMYRGQYNAKNHNSFIFASNQVDAVVIPSNDRRYNVALYQEYKLPINDEELKAINNELEEFYMYLMQHEVDESLVRTIVNTSARSQMVEVSKLAIEKLSECLREGDLVWFFDQLPADENLVPLQEQPILERYKTVLQEWVDNADLRKSNCLRDHIGIACTYLIGKDIPTQMYKLASYLKHYNLHVRQVSYHGVNQQGVNMLWKKYSEAEIKAMYERLQRSTNMPTKALIEEEKIVPKKNGRGRAKKESVV